MVQSPASNTQLGGGLATGRVARSSVSANNDVQARRRCVREEAVFVVIQ